MRALAFTALAVLTLASAPPASAATDGAAPPAAKEDRANAAPAAKGDIPLSERSLDDLYAALATEKDEAAADAAEREIQRRWMISGSDTVDLLMSWAQDAMTRQDFGTALSYLDTVTILKPNYAEGWNRRATLHFMRDDYGKAIADLEKVIRLEPRHFGALSGLGMMLREIGEEDAALPVLRRALEIDPRLSDEVRKAVDELALKVEGSPI